MRLLERGVHQLVEEHHSIAVEIVLGNNRRWHVAGSRGARTR
jgi:hypothetical protein